MFKSIKTGVLVVILIGTAIIARAQQTINECTIIYGVEYLLNDEQKKLVDPSVLPSESKVEFNGNISKVQIDMGMAMVKIITDGAIKNALLLVDIPMMQKQYAAKMSKADIEKQSGSLKFSDFTATGEKQNIAGFNAEKYTYKDNNGIGYEVWTTTELKLPAGTNPPGFEGVKGTPVKFTNTQDGIKTLLTLKSVKEGKVGSFSLAIPAGYEEKTMAELNTMRGGQ